MFREPPQIPRTRQPAPTRQPQVLARAPVFDQNQIPSPYRVQAAAPKEPPFPGPFNTPGPHPPPPQSSPFPNGPPGNPGPFEPVPVPRPRTPLPMEQKIPPVLQDSPTLPANDVSKWLDPGGGFTKEDVISAILRQMGVE